jgi:glycine C-acetyltransferase/8-amino-7-oxononanoate synthase
VIEIEARLGELERLGLHRRTRLVSGPQGPHVLLDGKPVLMLSSNNYLGLADHPRVREAAAEAAMRWGVGAGASRLISGTMTIHRRLEERLAEFKGRQSALLFGSGFLANTGVISALARPGDVIFSDQLNHASIIDGCRMSRAEVFVYDHLDVEHLEWGIAKSEGRGALIVTDSVFSMDGDVAPLDQIVEVAHRRSWPRGTWSTCRGGARGPGRRDRGNARKGARFLWGFRRVRSGDGRLPHQLRAHVHLLDRAFSARGGRRAGRARPARIEARARDEAPGQRGGAPR